MTIKASKTSFEYSCDCGTKFVADKKTKENYLCIDKQLIPECPDCGSLMASKTGTNWPRILLFPFQVVMIFLHFLICSALTICIHPESKRYKFYEYYAPWGWGQRKCDPKKD